MSDIFWKPVSLEDQQRKEAFPQILQHQQCPHIKNLIYYSLRAGINICQCPKALVCTDIYLLLCACRACVYIQIMQMS